MGKYTNIAVGLAILSIPVVALGDVIFPAFLAPYIAVAFYPVCIIAILVSETWIYKFLSPSLSLWQSFSLSVMVNIASSLTGICLALLLPSGLESTVPPPNVIEPAPKFMLFAVLGVVLAYLLSIKIEAYGLKFAARWVPVKRPFHLSLIANTVSYALVALILWTQM